MRAGRAAGATALLALAGVWTLCCVLVFGRFLSGTQPVDSRFRASLSSSADTVDQTRRTSLHGASYRHGFHTFTGHDDFATRRHGDKLGADAFPLRGNHDGSHPYGDGDVNDADGAMRVFSGHAAFDAQRERKNERKSDRDVHVESIDRNTRPQLRKSPQIEEDIGLGKLGERGGSVLTIDEKIKQAEQMLVSSSAVGMESAPEFDEAGVDSLTLDDVDEPNVISEDELGADLLGIARRIAEREKREEQETLVESVKRLKAEAMGRKGKAG
jgi:hypothetical protein|tara:strand:+ start:3053 stop:3865 length:813 start_codon:yes stop_codon:yes gene_type:complete